MTIKDAKGKKVNSFKPVKVPAEVEAAEPTGEPTFFGASGR
ncbi:hypothetical protein [Arthrobacter sp. GCM10027362]